MGVVNASSNSKRVRCRVALIIVVTFIICCIWDWTEMLIAQIFIWNLFDLKYIYRKDIQLLYGKKSGKFSVTRKAIF